MQAGGGAVTAALFLLTLVLVHLGFMVSFRFFKRRAETKVRLVV